MLKQLKKVSFGLLCLPTFVAFGSPMFEAKGVNEHIRVRTLTPNHTYTQAGIKINTPGYRLSMSGTQCTPKPNGYCTFTVSDKVRKTLSVTGPTGNVAFTLCLDGVGKLSCQNYTASILIDPINTYPIGGTVNGLTQTGLILQNNGTDDLSLQPFVSPYEFPIPVPQGGSYDVTILRQPVGEFCSLINDSGTNVQSPITDVDVNCRSVLTYISDATGVTRCETSNTGALNNCTLTYVTPLNPYGVAINNNRTFALVALNGNGTVASCPIFLDGTFDQAQCADSGVGGAFSGTPTGIVLNKANTIAYVVSGEPQGTITKCNFNNTTGKLSNCVAQSAPTGLISFSADIKLNQANTYLYIASPHNNNPAQGLVARCAIQANGSLSNCISVANINDAQGVFFNATETLAYVASYNQDKVYRCTVVNGGLTGCAVLAPTFNQPFTGVVNNRSTMAYVTNSIANGSVSMCPISATGTFSTCQDSGFSFNQPNIIVSFN